MCFCVEGARPEREKRRGLLVEKGFSVHIFYFHIFFFFVRARFNCHAVLKERNKKVLLIVLLRNFISFLRQFFFINASKALVF